MKFAVISEAFTEDGLQIVRKTLEETPGFVRVLKLTKLQVVIEFSIASDALRAIRSILKLSPHTTLVKDINLYDTESEQPFSPASSEPALTTSDIKSWVLEASNLLSAENFALLNTILCPSPLSDSTLVVSPLLAFERLLDICETKEALLKGLLTICCLFFKQYYKHIFEASQAIAEDTKCEQYEIQNPSLPVSGTPIPSPQHWSREEQKEEQLKREQEESNDVMIIENPVSNGGNDNSFVGTQDSFVEIPLNIPPPMKKQEISNEAQQQQQQTISTASSNAPISHEQSGRERNETEKTATTVSSTNDNEKIRMLEKEVKMLKEQVILLIAEKRDAEIKLLSALNAKRH